MPEMKTIKEKDEAPSFEDVLEELGSLGRFQLIQIAFCYMSMLTQSFIVLSFVFLGYQPPHVCNGVNETDLLTRYQLENESTAQIIYKACEIEISSESSGELIKVGAIDCPNGRDFFDAKHTTFLSEWDLVCESKGVAEFSQTLYSIGQMIGGFLASYIVDRVGRKPVFIGCSLLATLIELCIVAAPNIFVIYGLRFASGIFFQGIASSFFVYAMEFVPTRRRELNGVVMCALWVIGVLVVGAVAFIFRNDHWKYFQAAVGISGLVSILYPFFLHESPRWLVANGKTEEALRILEKASKTNGKDFSKVKETFLTYVAHAFPSSKPDKQELLATSEYVSKHETAPETDTKKRLSMLTLLRVKSLRGTTLISSYLFTTNVLTYFGLYMTSSKVAGDRFVNFTLMTLVEFPCCLCLMVMLKKMNRRLVMQFFLGLTAISLMSSALLTSLGEGLDGAATASTALFILGKFAISASFNVIFIVLPELYPTNLRGTAYGLCFGVSRVGAMVAPFLRPLFHLVKWGPGLIFTVMCGISVILTMLLPETKDENLPDTVDDLENKKKDHQVVNTVL